MKCSQECLTCLDSSVGLATIEKKMIRVKAPLPSVGPQPDHKHRLTCLWIFSLKQANKLK